MMFKVINKGLLTTVQDVRGRQGVQYLGFPPSGAMDTLALTVGNVLVGNDPNEAGLEYTFCGPHLLFEDDALIAVTGAPMKVLVDGTEYPMWSAIAVRKGQKLVLTPESEKGQWGYITVAGGIDVPKYLGSKATFSFCKIGGFKGRVLTEGDEIPVGKPVSFAEAGKRLKGRYIPVITSPMVVELMEGYYVDFLTDEDVERIFSANWKILTNSNRTGYRISGPHIEFSEKARNKGVEAGADPSNIFDTGYPAYAINMCGDTSIILTTEAVCAGGYFCPFCIPIGAQWKIGQARIGTEIRFRLIDMKEADRLREEFDGYLREDHYTK
jgi:biotin-dependent carboxylase-like uncharacterized protein